MSERKRLFSGPIKDKSINRLVSRAEVLEAQRLLAESGNNIEIRTYKTDPEYQDTMLYGYQIDYLHRFWNLALQEQESENISMGRHHIADRLYNILGEELGLEGEIEPNDEYNELWDALQDLYVFMGTTASGKTYHSSTFAAKYGLTCVDKDILHPKENVLKMKDGIPLTPKDREVWVQAVADMCKQLVAMDLHTAIAFPAHTEQHRQILRNIIERVQVIRCSAPIADLVARCRERDHPYIPNDPEKLMKLLRKQKRQNRCLRNREKRCGDFEVRSWQRKEPAAVQEKILTGVIQREPFLDGLSV